MFTRNLSEQAWRDGCYDELARRSLDAGVTVQETQDGAAMVGRLISVIGGSDYYASPRMEDGEAVGLNVIRLADVRGQR